MFENVFQFIPATGKLSNLKWPYHFNEKNVIVFDLEDSLQNVIDPHQTPIIKEKGRRQLLRYFTNFSTKRPVISLRINQLNTIEFKLDLALLSGLSNYVNWEYIFLPKLESKDELLKYKAIFSEFNITYNFLVPIIETTHGMLNLAQIINENIGCQLKYFVWGHHDYNLDAGYWPFIEQDNKKYWEIYIRFVQQVEDAGYQNLMGPYMQLKNDEQLLAYAKQTKQICKKPAAHVALTYRQAKILSSLTANAIQQTETIFENSSQTNHTELAEKIVASFHSSQQLSFKTNKDADLFISPQQFMAAQNFLKNHSND